MAFKIPSLFGGEEFQWDDNMVFGPKGKWRLVRKIAQGGNSEVYVGICIATGEEVALKLEKANGKYILLPNESKMYNILKGGKGIPKKRWYGQDKSKKYNCLVTDICGPNLDELFQLCLLKFSMKTVIMLALQMLDRIEFVHNKNYVHRDIKPENFAMGSGRLRNRVFLLDFGVAKKYCDDRTRSQVLYGVDKARVGSTRYCSLNVHHGIKQSRRDDLESLAYCIMYFNRGSLPWQGRRAGTKKQKFELVTESKMRTSSVTLCMGFAAEFQMFVNYCKNLLFDEEPDYKYLRNLLRILADTENIELDFDYDWIKEQRKQEALVAAAVPGDEFVIAKN